MNKILHLLAQRPGMTGSGVFARSLINEAGSKGYEQAFIYASPIYDQDEIPDHISDKNAYPVFFESENLPFPVAGMSDVMPYKNTKYSDLNDEMLLQWKQEFTQRIQSAVTEFEPDVIISHHLWLLTGLAKQLYPEIPVIGVCHSTDIRQMSLCQHFAPEVKNNIQKIDAVLALNEDQKVKIINTYDYPQNKIQVTGTGYNSKLFFADDNKVSDGKIRLAYVGKLSKAKGVDSLVRVFERLTTMHEGLELNLFSGGSGKEADELREMIKRSDAKINLFGIIPMVKLGEELRKLDVFILPSFYEGLPLVVIEGIASGLLVVCNDLPGVKEWIGCEMNNSGGITYVKMPGLVNKDVPVAKDLPDYEQRLESSIEKMLIRIKENELPDKDMVSSFLSARSWKGLFGRIELVMQSITPNN